MMTTKHRKGVSVGVKRTVAAIACMALALPIVSTPIFQTTASFADSTKSSKFYTDFETMDDAKSAAEKHQIQVQAEGSVLLKNEKESLPLDGNEWVSVFGEQADSVGGYSFIQALKDEGFKVNETLKKYYDNNARHGSSNIGGSAGMGNKTFPDGTQEINEFNDAVTSSFKMYNEAAIIVLRRGGGEGSKADGGATITTEEADVNDVASHENLAKIDGKEVKHSNMMSDDEKKLLETVKAQGFKKIIYVISSALPFEVKPLKDDAQVDGMLWIGTPGENGTKAVAQILSGKVNPSGKTSDTWYSDFTADPTWKNVGNNNHNGNITTSTDNGKTVYDYSQTASATYLYKDSSGDLQPAGYTGALATNNFKGYYGLDYEEGIYRGYRYYETRAYEMNKKTAGKGDSWYNTAMTYPFGYGLSYTSFEYSDIKVTLDDKTVLDNGMEVAANKFACDTGVTNYIKTATVTVTVKNTGSTAGKEAVQIYSSAPYTGKVEKSHVVLVGFEKTKTLKPGQSQTLEIEFNIQDMASYDAEGKVAADKKGYVLEEGDYTIYAMSDSHNWADTDVENYDKNRDQHVSFKLNGDAHLLLDDYSGNKTNNVYSAENGMFYSIRDNKNDTYNMSHYKINEDENANMTLLSRKDLSAATTAEIASFPQAPTEADRTLTADALNAIEYWSNFRIGNAVKDFLGNEIKDTQGNTIIYKDGQTILGTTGNIVNGDMDFPWVATGNIDESRMANWDQAATALEGNNIAKILVKDLAGISPYSTDADDQKLWDDFMNQLTWDEMQALIATAQKSEFTSIGYNAYKGSDSALNYANTYAFNCNSVLSATWNKELAEKQGILVGNMALLKGNNVWWGPGAQTHRSYFDNRASEYCSDDPYLSGTMASLEVIGVQSKGVVACVKHCTLYEDSGSPDGTYTVNTNNGSFNWSSEQAIREISMRPVQLCAQEGQCDSVMGSFNRIGRVGSCSNWNTTTDLFRTQWGAEEMTWTTDIYFRVGSFSPIDLIARIGGDNIDQRTKITGTWDATKKTVMVPTGANGALEESKATYYVTRMSAMRIVAMHANSAINKNGVDFNDWTSEEFTATQGTSLTNASIKANTAQEEATVVEYTVTRGVLPAGVSIDSKAGTLTGIPTEEGVFEFTLTCKADGWISSTQTFKLTVASAFDEEGLSGKVGEAFEGFVFSETFDAGTYTLSNGTLPAGLTLKNDGTISGTPEESGTFPVVLNISVKSGNKFTNYTYATKIVVSGGNEATDINTIIAELQAKVDAFKNYDDAELKAAIAEVKATLEGVKNYDDAALKASVDALTARVAELEAAQTDEGGCNSSINVGTAIMIATALLGSVVLAIVLRKKQKND